MNWCKPHWERLRQFVDKKGLTKFVPTNGAEAKRRLTSNEDTVENFDPLMGSWMQINRAMLESPKINNRLLHCPLCILVDDGQPDLVDNWLDGVTNDALDHAIKNGWIEKN